jgi:quercetin dioxygenase-like cupin family protein
MMKITPAKYGKLGITVYDFEFPLDTLPMHTHDEYSNHISIISRGSFRVHGDGWEMVAKSGDVIDFEVGQSHEFIALEPNSRFVNIAKGAA